MKIFDEESWIEYNYEHYEKWRIVAKNLLEEARTFYCKFSLYQSMGNRIDNNDTSRTLLNIIETEEFSPQSFMGVLNRWMGAYSQIKQSLNTLIIVGGPRTYAETFCNSLLNIFSCVITCDLHQKDFTPIFRMASQIKMLYFPPTSTKNIENPHTNMLMSGRYFMVPVDDKLVKVPQIKCLVRMEESPDWGYIKLAPQQHFIIQFKHEVRNPINFNIQELRRLMKRYLENDTAAGNRTPTICSNEYSFLCSTANYDYECDTCSRVHVF